MTSAAVDPLTRIDVSREAITALQNLEALVRRWTPAINLIASSTSVDIWTRHILDSAQLFPLAPSEAHHWVDLGSGAGFPGLVIAIIARDLRRELMVTLIESDTRKATFLREASRTLNLSCTVLNTRIEAAAAQSADIVSARALSPLVTLLGLANKHLHPDGTAIFPKGRNWEDELKQARKEWSFEVDVVKSTSSDQAAILLIRKIERDPHR